MKRKESLLSSESTNTILESISDGVFTVNHEWRITSFNRAAEEITGVSRAEAIGRRCCEVFRSDMCESHCALRHTMDSGQSVINKSGYIINAEGRQVPISVSTALLRNKAGVIEGGVETFRDLSLVEELRKEIRQQYECCDIVSRSASMRKLFDILPQVATSDATTVIEGESGTGKELLARALHQMSHRRKKSFIAINCGALPDTLLESELFGYKAGAFTGAKKDKPGRFALAEGGTLFLDELGDISSALQVKLLRVLQEKAYEPLGSARSVASDVRIIAATNKSLDQLVQAGVFRQDLYYRINVIRLELPPLRHRKEDIPLLVEHFILRFNHTRGREIAGISPEAMAALMHHDYPGNIRELENVIEHAFALCRTPVIDITCLPDLFLRPSTPAPIGATSPDLLKAAESRVILEMLEQYGGNREKAAKALGMHKSTLFRKLRSLNLHPPKPGG